MSEVEVFAASGATTANTVVVPHDFPDHWPKVAARRAATTVRDCDGPPGTTEPIWDCEYAVVDPLVADP